MEKFKEILKEYFLFICGSIIAAFGTGAFLLPNQLSSGGFSGIATIIFYSFNIPMGTTILVLNIPLFIWAYFKCGKHFMFKSLIATFLFSYFINFFEARNPFTDDRILASVYGGILIGIGLSLVFKGKSSTGGTDLLANIIKSYKSEVTLSNIVLILDVIIVTINMIFLGEIEIGLYSAIAIYIDNKMIDLVFEGINFTKMIYIISDKYEEIAETINTQIDRGATGIYGQGMYTKKNKMIIMCVAKRRDVVKIKDAAKKIDENAFLIITDARNVYGLGF